MGRELELKFAASSETLDAMEEKYAPLTPIAMHTRYFDTPHQAFRGEGGPSGSGWKTGGPSAP